MGGGSLFFNLRFGEGHLKKCAIERRATSFWRYKYYHLSLNSNLSLFHNYYRLHRKIKFFNKTTCIMERHGLPGVAALKIITKHLNTFLFEVHINLKIKHDKMSAEAITICHQYKLLFEHKHYIFRR